jgi:outer membrane murein-binding lipoprotein Lpp
LTQAQAALQTAQSNLQALNSQQNQISSSIANATAQLTAAQQTSNQANLAVTTANNNLATA